MRSALILTCVIIFADNFIGASQFKLSKASQLNTLSASPQQEAGQGQDEYYVPAYFNPYQQQLSYQQLLDSLGTEPLSAEQQYERPQEPSVVALPPASRFPSLVSPSISLNGADSFSKYKPSKTKAKPLSAEFRNLLASIKAIQPVVDERLDQIGDYIKEASHRQQQQAAQQRARNLPRPNEFGQAEIYENPFDYAVGPNDAGSSSDSSDKPRQKLLPFAAESMANPYDEIQANLDTFKRQAPKGTAVTQMDAAIGGGVGRVASVREPKARRKLTNSEPSRLQTSHNLVLPPKAYQQPIESGASKESLLSSMSDVYFVAIVACVSSVAIFSVIGAGYCFYKVQQSNKAAQDVEFPAYGVIGPASRADNNGAKCSSPPADRKLAQSAQMYHYHHQKQQMISNEKNANIPRHAATSDVESDEENEDGEYTVYECPGLAPTGEMEVKNPLFQDDLTPMSSPSVNGNANKDSPKPKVDTPPTCKGTAPKNETD